MTSSEIRDTFFSFFQGKNHAIVPSAPMVIKDDPTLMFTNAGMNQFKDIFLGNNPAKSPRVANTQKCLRVSGKHNDLDEVGHDTYHHTMFEMLGNWSFGDYFKKEAIAWAWELLTEVYGLEADRLYASVFEGDASDGLEADNEALTYWKAFVPEERIVMGKKKDNFWEMGDTGPCGPCSEIHIDLRDDEERKKISGRELVNEDHPLVVEVWNLVFIEFNRKSDGNLEPLPAKHIDTGMGFERLCMALQSKKSNYETDVFTPFIKEISRLTETKYGEDEETDIAIRVISDHLRAVAFAIADGQLPSNNKAGYVIRRILRRAVRYAYTFLGQKEPFMHLLVDLLVEQMGTVFTELPKQQDLIKKVIIEEELSFLRTLSTGIQKFNKYVSLHADEKIIDGDFAFELFDTYGFPIDLTQLMAREKGIAVDMEGFEKGLNEQKERSRQAGLLDTDDWVEILPMTDDIEFVGWDTLECEVNILRYRKVESKSKKLFQVVMDRTPFYAEAGGQVGDKGWLLHEKGKVRIIDTKRENNLIVHYTKELPDDLSGPMKAVVDPGMRNPTMRNHTATHLMHHALRSVLGEHVEQKGSMVDADRFRFDFSHFQKLSEEEIADVEDMVNALIRNNNPLDEFRSIPMDEATSMGAMALFGEKYGDTVRVIKFGESVELCGGTHVKASGDIGYFKIISEGGIAAGIRRIEAISGLVAELYVREKEDTLTAIKGLFKNSGNILRSVEDLIAKNEELGMKLQQANRSNMQRLAVDLKEKAEVIEDIQLVTARIDEDNQFLKDLAFLMHKTDDPLVIVFGNKMGEKAGLTIMISDNLVKDRKLNAGEMIRTLSGFIKGGGGGQPHFATAGGKDAGGIEMALSKAPDILREKLASA